MSKKQLIENLMAIAKQPLKKTIEALKGDNYNPAQKFSIMRDIVSSNSNFVPTYMIYECYLSWCAEYNQTPINKIQFFKDFSKIYNKQKKNGDMCYLVESYIFTNLTSAELEVFDKAYSKRNSENAKKRVKNKSKKQNHEEDL